MLRHTNEESVKKKTLAHLFLFSSFRSSTPEYAYFTDMVSKHRLVMFDHEKSTREGRQAAQVDPIEPKHAGTKQPLKKPACSLWRKPRYRQTSIAPFLFPLSQDSVSAPSAPSGDENSSQTTEEISTPPEAHVVKSSNRAALLGDIKSAPTSAGAWELSPVKRTTVSPQKKQVTQKQTKNQERVASVRDVSLARDAVGKVGIL